MVAQLVDEDMRWVVEGDSGRGGGLVGAVIVPQKNSYDHARHHADRMAGRAWGQQPGEQLAQWDFVVIRADKTMVRMHPEWSKTRFAMKEVNGFEELPALPQRGAGGSDGPGTYKRYKEMGRTGFLRFDAAKWTPGKLNDFDGLVQLDGYEYP